jgi:hypothetical protein
VKASFWLKLKALYFVSLQQDTMTTIRRRPTRIHPSLLVKPLLPDFSKLGQHGDCLKNNGIWKTITEFAYYYPHETEKNKEDFKQWRKTVSYIVAQKSGIIRDLTGFYNVYTIGNHNGNMAGVFVTNSYLKHLAVECALNRIHEQFWRTVDTIPLSSAPELRFRGGDVPTPPLRFWRDELGNLDYEFNSESLERFKQIVKMLVLFNSEQPRPYELKFSIKFLSGKKEDGVEYKFYDDTPDIINTFLKSNVKMTQKGWIQLDIYG